MAKRSRSSELQTAVEELWGALDGISTSDALIIVKDAALRVDMLRRIAALEDAGSAIRPARIISEEVMARLGCKSDYLIALKRIGAIGCIRVGKRDLYDAQQIDSFVSSMAKDSFRHSVNRKLKALRDAKTAGTTKGGV